MQQAAPQPQKTLAHPPEDPSEEYKESNKKYIYRYNEEYGPHANKINIVDVDADDDFKQDEEDLKSLLNVS